MNVYSFLSWMVLPHILMVGPLYVYFHLPQNSQWQLRLLEIIAVPLVFQFLLWISYKIVFLLIKHFFEGPEELVRLEEVD